MIGFLCLRPCEVCEAVKSNRLLLILAPSDLHHALCLDECLDFLKATVLCSNFVKKFQDFGLLGNGELVVAGGIFQTFGDMIETITQPNIGTVHLLRLFC